MAGSECGNTPGGQGWPVCFLPPHSDDLDHQSADFKWGDGWMVVRGGPDWPGPSSVNPASPAVTCRILAADDVVLRSVALELAASDPGRLIEMLDRYERKGTPG
jgi:hypothetical protein